MKSSITCKVNIGIVTFSKIYRNDAAVVMQKNFTDSIQILILLHCNICTKIEGKELKGTSRVKNKTNSYYFIDPKFQQSKEGWKNNFLVIGFFFFENA